MGIYRKLFIIISTCVLFAGCQVFPDHYMIYSADIPKHIIVWNEDRICGNLLVHLEWAQPEGKGPFPTVLVHPEGGKTAQEMQGIILDLAKRGYLAVAADYKRWLDGEFQRNTFAWRENTDALAAVNIIIDNPQVNKQRIATLGFSQGGMYSLIIAAKVPSIKTVIAYYPVTDFRKWFDTYRPNPIRRWVFSIIEWHFRQESGAQTNAEFERLLAKASPINYAEDIHVPVLLIHGEEDTSAPIQESIRLKTRLNELGQEVSLMRVTDAGHIFNFRQPEKAREAWQVTIAWLESYLGQ